MSKENIEAFESFLAAFERSDIQGLSDWSTDSLEVWHSNTGETHRKAEVLARVEKLLAQCRIKNTVIDRIVDGDRIAQRHEMHVKIAGGQAEARLHVVMFATLEGGRVSRLDEVLNPIEVQRLYALIDEVSNMPVSVAG